MEQPDSALIYLCRYTSIDSTDLNINRLKAYAYNQAGLHQDAIKLYQKIRQSGDRQASTEYYLGLSYAYTDSLSQAYDCLVRANNLSERKNAYILSQLGVIGSKIGMIKESQQDIKDALDLLQPDKQLVTSLYETAATNHIQLHQYKDAIACYDKILKKTQRSCICYTRRPSYTANCNSLNKRLSITKNSSKRSSRPESRRNIQICFKMPKAI